MLSFCTLSTREMGGVWACVMIGCAYLRTAPGRRRWRPDSLPFAFFCVTLLGKAAPLPRVGVPPQMRQPTPWRRLPDT